MSAAKKAGAILAVDAGTTGVTAVVVTSVGLVAARAHRELRWHSPQPGWAEQVPEEIWQALRAATRDCLDTWDGAPGSLSGIGLTHRRETATLWDRETLGSPRRAIVSEDRRAADICSMMRHEGHEGRITELTGLRLDPGLSGPRLRWLAENEPHTWALVDQGRYAVGTVDSYVVARMTRGTWHLTGVSDAHHTLLFDLRSGAWSQELCDLFRVPMDAPPQLAPQWGELARTDPRSFLGLDLPITRIAGDQQSSVFDRT